jgi:hypothetical protein
MANLNYSKFTRYLSLNEISKFSNFNNLHLLSQIKTVSFSFYVDSSFEKSKLLYYSKSLLSVLLISLITGKYPIVKSSKDQKILHIESTLSGLDLKYFLENFFIVSNSKYRKSLIKNIKIKNSVIRFLITDLNLFTELSSIIHLFSLVDFLYLDITLVSGDDFRNFIFIDNLFKSSYSI